MRVTLVVTVFLFLSLTSTFGEIQESLSLANGSGASRQLTVGFGQLQPVSFLEATNTLNDAGSALAEIALNAAQTARQAAETSAGTARDSAKTLSDTITALTVITADTDLTAWVPADFDSYSTTLDSISTAISDSTTSLETATSNTQSAIAADSSSKERANNLLTESTRVVKVRTKEVNAVLTKAFEATIDAAKKVIEAKDSLTTKYQITASQAETLSPKMETLKSKIATVLMATAEAPGADDSQPCLRSEYYDSTQQKCISLSDSPGFVPTADQTTYAMDTETSSIASWVTSGLGGLLLTMLLAKLMFKLLLHHYKQIDERRSLEDVMDSTSEKLTKEATLLYERMSYENMESGVRFESETRLEKQSKDMKEKTAACLSIASKRIEDIDNELGPLQEEIRDVRGFCNHRAARKDVIGNKKYRHAFWITFLGMALVQLFSFCSIRFQSDPIRTPAPTPKILGDEIARDTTVAESETDPKRKADLKTDISDRVAARNDDAAKSNQKLNDMESQVNVGSNYAGLFIAQVIVSVGVYAMAMVLMYGKSEGGHQIADESYLQKLFMSRQEYMHEIAIDFMTLVCVILVTVRGYRYEMGRGDLGLNFALMTLIQLQVGNIVAESSKLSAELKHGINGKSLLPFLPAGAILFHAVMFPFMLVYRVRKQRVDQAITPIQLQNLHFISDFFGCMFVGVAIASTMMDNVSPAFAKDLVYRFGNSAKEEMKKLRHYVNMSEKETGPWRELYSTRFLLALKTIDKDYFCAALALAEEESMFIGQVGHKVFEVLKPLRNCGNKEPKSEAEAQDYTPEPEVDHKKIEEQAKILSKAYAALDDIQAYPERNQDPEGQKNALKKIINDANVVIKELNKANRPDESVVSESPAFIQAKRTLDLLKAEGFKKILEILTHPDLLKDDRSENSGTLWGLIAAGYYGCIYNIIDMANGMTGDHDIKANNIFAVMFAFFLFLTARLVFTPQSSIFSPRLTSRIVKEGDKEDTGPENLGLQCVRFWRGPIYALPLPSECAASCRKSSVCSYFRMPYQPAEQLTRSKGPLILTKKRFIPKLPAIWEGKEPTNENDD